MKISCAVFVSATLLKLLVLYSTTVSECSASKGDQKEDGAIKRLLKKMFYKQEKPEQKPDISGMMITSHAKVLSEGSQDPEVQEYADSLLKRGGVSEKKSQNLQTVERPNIPLLSSPRQQLRSDIADELMLQRSQSRDPKALKSHMAILSEGVADPEILNYVAGLQRNI